MLKSWTQEPSCSLYVPRLGLCSSPLPFQWCWWKQTRWKLISMCKNLIYSLFSKVPTQAYSGELSAASVIPLGHPSSVFTTSSGTVPTEPSQAADLASAGQWWARDRCQPSHALNPSFLKTKNCSFCFYLLLKYINIYVCVYFSARSSWGEMALTWPWFFWKWWQRILTLSYLPADELCCVCFR